MFPARAIYIYLYNTYIKRLKLKLLYALVMNSQSPRQKWFPFVILFKLAPQQIFQAILFSKIHFSSLRESFNVTRRFAQQRHAKSNHRVAFNNQTQLNICRTDLSPRTMKGFQPYNLCYYSREIDEKQMGAGGTLTSCQGHLRHG